MLHVVNNSFYNNGNKLVYIYRAFLRKSRDRKRPDILGSNLTTMHCSFHSDHQSVQTTSNNSTKNPPSHPSRLIYMLYCIISNFSFIGCWQSLGYKACRLRFCSSVAACFGGALEGRGRLSAPECVCHRHSRHRLS